MSMLQTDNRRFFCVGILTLVTALCASSQASLLVYEGFANYGTSGNINGKTVSSNAVGLTGNYATYFLGWGNNTEQYATLANGLSLGSNFASASGSGALYLRAFNTNRVPTVGVALTASASSAITAGNTLYSSLLFNLNTASSFGSSSLQERISTAQNSSSGVLSISPDSGSGTQPSVGYAGGTSTASYTLSAGTTYLMIAKYTNVGATGGGSATLWVLNQAAYNNWFNAGHTEATLGSYALASVTNNSASTISSANYLQFALSTGFPGSGESPQHAGTFDELRYATTLNESLGMEIPEPASAAVIALGMVAVVGRRRAKA